jgi:hypothetical protein
MSNNQDDTYTMVNDRTGEIVPVDMFIEKIPKQYWERAYAKVLAEYIGVAGTATNTVLAWLIKNKDSNNRIIGTFAIIAKECKTTVPTVSTLFQKLYKKEFLKKVHNGVYMLSPSLLRHGSQTKGAILFKKWGDCDTVSK